MAGVIIGRFQTAKLTQGHIRLLEVVASKDDKVVVLLGTSAKLSTKENPLGYESRERMIRDWWNISYGTVVQSHKKLLIAPLPNRATDTLWSKQIDTLLNDLLGPRVRRTLYGGRDSCLSHYEGNLPIEELDLDIPCSATEQRDLLFDAPPETAAGRAGAIWAMGNQWSRIDPCVDMAVTSKGIDGGTYLLMGKKLTGVGKFCFPGGHIDTTDKSAEAAATREIKEETDLDNLDPWSYVCQVPVNDWRNTKTCQTWSTLFHVELEPKRQCDAIADDDLDEVQWVNMRTVKIEDISPTHLPMFQTLLKYLNLDNDNDIPLAF